MEFNYLQRVKVYRLNDEGKWDDKGTGHVSVEYLERSDAVGLVVIDEEDNQTLLVHRISADDIYRRQEDTIISWTDPEVATDLALSFQETMGCSFIWDQICSVQRSTHFPSVGGMEGNTRSAGDDLENSDDAFREGVAPEMLELPPVEISNLLLIVKAVAAVAPFDRDRVASVIVRDQNYIPKLVQLFRTCEDLKNLKCLRLMFKIVKGIMLLNDGHIFDIIFSDEYMMDIIGALEYDPDAASRQDHRTFLKEQVIFKEAVPIRDPAILSKIHQTYRIGYIKDVILSRLLDDATLATINSIVLFNNVSVVTALQNDSAFLSELFSRLRSSETPDRTWRDLVFFVQEFCNLSKHLQAEVGSQLYSALVKEGLFDIVEDILKDADEVIRLSGCDILIVVLNHNPALLRTFLVHQPDHTLFSVLVDGMLTPSKGGLQAKLLEVMRMLLDTETMETASSKHLPPADKSLFLEVFYERYMDQMVQLLVDGCPPEAGSIESTNESSIDVGKGTRRTITPEILGNVCELMCFCVQHHQFRIKYYVMRNHVVEKVLRLTRRKEKYLVVAAVRFLRTCVALKDEFYYRYIVKHNLFEIIIGVFMANGNRYNLLNSAVLELIDFIRKEGIKTLVVHLIEKFSSKLESIDYVDTFRALKLKYEQLLEGPLPSTRDAGTITSVSPDHGIRTGRNRHNLTDFVDYRKRKDERALDKDEEDYFNEDSDDEEDTATAGVSPASQPPSLKAVVLNGSAVDRSSLRESTIGLVDYDDEDEDMPATSGINGKNLVELLDKKTENLLPAVPLTSPLLEVETDTFVKRKTPLAPTLEETDGTSSKRQKPDDIQAVDCSTGQFAYSNIIDTNRVGSCTTNSEDLGFSEPTMLGSTSPTVQDVDSKGRKPEDLKACSVDQHGSGTANQASSLDHISCSPEAVPDMDGEHTHQHLDTAPPGLCSGLPSVNACLIAMDTHLSHDKPAETAVAPTENVMVSGSAGLSEDKSLHDVTGDVVRETYANGGESPTLERGGTGNGADFPSSEDCSVSAFEVTERPETLLTKGVNDSSISVPQQLNMNSGCEGNGLSNLDIDNMTVTPTSPGSHLV
ncbi:uncharacterized protein [Physcomitrium patens]|uniref:Uncharacterized protein n=3 Tax=Physcomitrium patens TaxID=3218 RepID=A0A2K1JQE5_PHYPA|nr:serine/threonine-protein phosphatase 4 regulatory subunit 3-like isoform X2 [Physcomitrium patens]PNR43759.1 hypothetical protein PHYPA_016141 [Physcomitrium patens]|eukprot:XP_024390933.1 serine/threonine-protein phosphatase 4 regulatory subunit 3-like isoform X2 [Physcomitrella patens]